MVTGAQLALVAYARASNARVVKRHRTIGYLITDRSIRWRSTPRTTRRWLGCGRYQKVFRMTEYEEIEVEWPSELGDHTHLSISAESLPRFLATHGCVGCDRRFDGVTVQPVFYDASFKWGRINQPDHLHFMWCIVGTEWGIEQENQGCITRVYIVDKAVLFCSACWLTQLNELWKDALQAKDKRHGPASDVQGSRPPDTPNDASILSSFTGGVDSWDPGGEGSTD